MCLDSLIVLVRSAMAAGSVPSGGVEKHSNVDSNVFICWDNSNIFYEAQNVAEEVEGEVMDVRSRIRIDFHNLLYLARESRTLVRGVVAWSIPPELDVLWAAMEAEGVRVDRFDRGRASAREQEVPDVFLQYQMLNDSIRETPGTMVLLTGDGAGYVEGKGFRFTFESVKMLGWKVEVLSWVNSCNVQCTPPSVGPIEWVIFCTCSILQRDHLDCAIQQGARSKWEACCSHTAVEKKMVHETSGGGVATLRNLGSQPRDRTSSLGSSQNPSVDNPSPHTLYCTHSSIVCSV